MIKQSQSAFTLIELLVTCSIIACLSGLIIPSVTDLKKKADSTACLANLRQVGIAGTLYTSDHDQTFPTIEPWPSQPVYGANDNAGSLLSTLEPYGLTAAVLKCHTDIAGPNYYAKEGSSYEWCPMANGQNIHNVKLGHGDEDQSMPLSRLLVAFDYSNLHKNASNVLFGDGHVAAAE